MIKLLDCTLRDGGYVNDWKFGKSAIKDIKENLELSGVEIIELGFIKNEPKNKATTTSKLPIMISKTANKIRCCIVYLLLIPLIPHSPHCFDRIYPVY